MLPAPALAAVGEDLLWCLGLGLLVAAVRDAAALLPGGGPLRCFCLDLLAFAAAAVLLCGFAAGVSASGGARWYMAAAMGGGALGWHWALRGALHAAVRALAGAVCWPFAVLYRRLLRPVAAWLRTKMQKAPIILHPGSKKRKKMSRRSKKQLQKPRRVLYN